MSEAGKGDGGAAFPTTHPTGQVEEGMSLRDYLAARAMNGLLSADADVSMGHGQVAKLAYEQADAMLAARGVPDVS